MSCTRKQIVDQARSWLGLKESDGSFKVIIDTYNGHKPLARGYKLKYTDEWCAGFASACAIACGATDIIPTEVAGARHMIIRFHPDVHLLEQLDVLAAANLRRDNVRRTAGDGTGRCKTGTPFIGVLQLVASGALPAQPARGGAFRQSARLTSRSR